MFYKSYFLKIENKYTDLPKITEKRRKMILLLELTVKK